MIDIEGASALVLKSLGSKTIVSASKLTSGICAQYRVSSDFGAAGEPGGMFVNLVPTLDDEKTNGERWGYVFMLYNKLFIKAMTVRMRIDGGGGTVLDVKKRNAEVMATVSDNDINRALENFVGSWKRSESITEEERARPTTANKIAVTWKISEEGESAYINDDVEDSSKADNKGEGRTQVPSHRSRESREDQELPEESRSCEPH